MPSIDEILNNLGVEDSEQEKIASSEADTSFSESEVETQARELGLIDQNEEENIKVASTKTDGGNMDLQSFYDMHFGGDTEKVAGDYTVGSASNEEGSFTKEAAAEMEHAGEVAGVYFQSGLNERLLKFAMDGVADSAATQKAVAGGGVIPGAEVKPADQGLPKGNRGDADKKMDLTPEYYDLQSQAVAKAALVKAIAAGEPGALSHKTISVDSGLEMPASQKDA